MTAGTGFSWAEADRLFDEALEVAPADRARWLDDACAGNAALRDQVEALLRADAAAEGFLEISAVRCATPLLPEAETESPAGRLIGPYRVERELARGGMGVVYLAERADGQFEQRVALKLLKRGMDSDEIYRRFLAERQILARLNHPHIARLLDGGVSAEGQPYFALEYVDGTTILAHCEAGRLGVEDRLRLFLDVCDAVRYAHQNLVVHRDLKPPNILVTADGAVKLLDFGIAKVLHHEPGAEMRLTEPGLRVMTPEYAAPEQVSGEPVTTATDVYAPGAVLYELLARRRAHRIDRRTPAEIVRVVCEVDPPPPSAVAPAELRRRLRGDLDTIVLTALAKAPERRYPTVEQLASDIKRYLTRIPLAARAQSWRYRAAKFVARHRLGVATGAAVAVSLVAGLAGTMWQARVAAQQARAASAEAAKQRAVRDFLVQLFQASDPAQSLGRDITARELLDRGRRDIGVALSAQPAVRAELLGVLGAVHQSLGLVAPADTLFAEAVALTRSLPGNVDLELAARLTEWGDNLIDGDQYDRADTVLTEALQRLRRHSPDDPRAARPLRVLGRAQAYKGNNARAAELQREALAIDLRQHGPGSRDVAEDLGYLGYALSQTGDLAGADSATRAALAIWRNLLEPGHPRVLETMVDLASVNAVRGEFGEAEQLLREVLAGRLRVYPNGHPEVAQVLGELAYVVSSQNRPAEAESLYVKAWGMYRALLGPDHSNTTRIRYNLALLRFQEGELSEAERDMREVIGTLRRTLGPEYVHTLNSIDQLGALLREQGRYAEAERSHREALAGRRKVQGDSHPDVARSLRHLPSQRRARTGGAAPP